MQIAALIVMAGPTLSSADVPEVIVNTNFCEGILSSDISALIHLEFASLRSHLTPSARDLMQLVEDHFSQSEKTANLSIENQITYLGAVGSAQYFLSLFHADGSLNFQNPDSRALINDLKEESYAQFYQLKDNSRAATDWLVSYYLKMFRDWDEETRARYFQARGLHYTNELSLHQFLTFKNFSDQRVQVLRQKLLKGLHLRSVKQLVPLETLNQMILHNDWPLIVTNQTLNYDGVKNSSRFSSFLHDLIDHFLSYQTQVIQPEERTAVQIKLLGLTDPILNKIGQLIFYSVLHEREIGVSELMDLILNKKPLTASSRALLQKQIEIELTGPSRLEGYLDVAVFKSHFNEVLEILRK